MEAIDPSRLEDLLRALELQLRARSAEFDLVVIGGSALQALGLISRPTRDVDLLALRDGDNLIPAEPLPPDLEAARDVVARDFALPRRWLNGGPSALNDFGLPDGFLHRLKPKKIGPALTVHFAGRLDQIHFKLYAMVDQGHGRHEADLRALKPTKDELLAAARWTQTHDPSPGFRMALEQALKELGVEDGADST